MLKLSFLFGGQMLHYSCFLPALAAVKVVQALSVSRLPVACLGCTSGPCGSVSCCHSTACSTELVDVEITELTAGVAALESAMANATALRQAEKAKNEQTIADAKDAGAL
eukprot:4366693-Amphidinium_carterae.1